MNDTELVERLADVENRSKSNTHRLDRLESTTEAIHSIATSVEVMASEQRHQGLKLDEVVEDVKKINTEPADRWNSIVKTVLGAIVGAIVAYCATVIGLK